MKQRRKKQVVQSEKPGVDMERDIRLYRKETARRQRLRVLYRSAGVLLLFVGLFVCIRCCAEQSRSGRGDGGESQESESGSRTETATVENETNAPTKETESQASLYDFHPNEYPDGSVLIRPADLSESYKGNSYTVNESGYLPSLADDAEMKQRLIRASECGTDDPLVLIIHTHTSEAYDPNGYGVCDPQAEGFARSADTEQNIVAVGKILAETLKTHGITAVHCTDVFDAKSYRGAYDRAAKTIKEYLTRYPSIRLVIDVHRDSLTDSSGNLLRAVTTAEGETVGQVMCVVGTGETATECPWLYNYTLAGRLRADLNERYGNLCRPTVLRSASYNQQYAELSLLLEIGTSGNTLAEAQRAAKLVGESLSTLLLIDDGT